MKKSLRLLALFTLLSILLTGYAQSAYAETGTDATHKSSHSGKETVTLVYSGNRQESYSVDKMRSELGGSIVLLRNSCMDKELDCDLSFLFEVMDFAVMKGAFSAIMPLTSEEYSAAKNKLQLNELILKMFPSLKSFYIYTHDKQEGTYLISFSFNKYGKGSDSEIAEMLMQGRKEALRIVKKIPAYCNTGYNTDYKKIHYLYSYVTYYVKYTDHSYWTNGRGNCVLYDALIEHDTVCAGFAYSFAYLCELAGIDAQYVRVVLRAKDDGHHAVVMAKSNGKYGYYDPTWDVGKNMTGFKYFAEDFNNMFSKGLDVGYLETWYPRSLYPDCYPAVPGYVGHLGYWDFDANILRTFWNTEIKKGRYIISSALDNNRVLEIGGYSKENGGNAQIWYNGFIDFQQFDVSKNGDGYIIKNCGSSLVLDVQGGRAAAGTNVQQYENNSTAAQKWILEPSGGFYGEGYYYIKSALGNYYLEIDGNSAPDGANVRIAKYTGKDNQRWRFTAVNTSSISEGRYSISSALDNNRVLETGGFSTESKGNVQIWRNGFAAFQKFDVYKDNGGYIFKNCGSSLVLAVDSNGKKNTKNVWQYPYTTAKKQINNQRWTLKSAGDGYFYIKSASGKYYLEVAGKSAGDGINVRIAPFTGKDNQKWRFNLIGEMKVYF